MREFSHTVFEARAKDLFVNAYYVSTFKYQMIGEAHFEAV
jgi:hypothetical protein